MTCSANPSLCRSGRKEYRVAGPNRMVSFRDLSWRFLRVTGNSHWEVSILLQSGSIMNMTIVKESPSHVFKIYRNNYTISRNLSRKCIFYCCHGILSIISSAFTELSQSHHKKPRSFPNGTITTDVKCVCFPISVLQSSKSTEIAYYMIIGF